MPMASQPKASAIRTAAIYIFSCAMPCRSVNSVASSVPNLNVMPRMTFKFGTDEATELTERQVIAQLKMYIAAVRIADAFGCDAIGIQYQQGLKDLVPASDLAEGLLNNPIRPPVFDAITARELRPGQ